MLIPYFRTYTDFFVLLYALYVNDIPIPFTFGNLEDTPRNSLFDALLKRVGYILTRRSREQSFQEWYINRALFRELLNKHQMVILFQNDVRMKTGKFNQPTMPDVSIEWLLQTYFQSMQSERGTVHLIPISITKDRLLDMSNLASDMVSENKPQISLQKLRQTIKNTGGVGRIFLKFGDTIDLKQYLEQKNIA